MSSSPDPKSPSSTSLDDGVAFRGYLWKEGRVNKSFRRRYFVLLSRHLYYYKKESKYTNSKRPKGVVSLDKVEIAEYPEATYRGHASVFTISTLDRVYYLAAENEDDFTDWLYALRVELDPHLQRAAAANSTAVSSPKKRNGDSDSPRESSGLPVTLKEKISSMTREVILQYKFLIWGSPACGKTALMKRCVDNVFEPNYIETPDVTVYNKRLIIQDRKVDLRIVEIPGGRGAPKWCEDDSLLADVAMVILLLDVTDAASMGKVKRAARTLRDRFPSGDMGIAFVGTKVDQSSARTVTASSVELFGEELDGSYFECSAQSGMNCDKLFEWAFAQLVRAGIWHKRIPKKPTA